jgi:hypothetical protein
MADKLPVGQSVRNMTVDPSGASSNAKKLMSPNAKEDPETVTGDNPQKEWVGGSGKPKPPFGQKGRNF